MSPVSSFPPGPKGLPIIGSLKASQPFPQVAFKKWSLEEYGPIMSVKLGSRKMVILTTAETIKEAFIEKKSLTSSRPVSYIFEQEDGLSFLPETKKFTCQKSWGLDIFHKFATTGKLEEVVLKEANVLLKKLETVVENPVDVAPYIYWMSGNTLSTLLFGKTYSFEDKEAMIWADMFGADFKKITSMEFLPWTRHLPSHSGLYRRYWEKRKAWQDDVGRIVAEHKESFDEKNLNDFIDFYIREEKKPGAAEEGFTDDQLAAYIVALLGAGIPNKAITVVWMILCSLHFPEAYKLVVNEVDNVLGKEDEPTYDTRLKMPITCAFINEVYRFVSPLTRTAIHYTTGEVQLGKFVIPANTEVLGSLWGAHHDPVTWPDPMKFDLNRHLDQDGNFVDSDNIMIYGIGPRSCFAEHLSRVEIFILFTKFVRKFEFSSSGELPGIDEGVEKFTYNAKPFDVILKKRNFDEKRQIDNQEDNQDPEEQEDDQVLST